MNILQQSEEKGPPSQMSLPIVRKQPLKIMQAGMGREVQGVLGLKIHLLKIALKKVTAALSCFILSFYCDKTQCCCDHFCFIFCIWAISQTDVWITIKYIAVSFTSMRAIYIEYQIKPSSPLSGLSLFADMLNLLNVLIKTSPSIYTVSLNIITQIQDTNILPQCSSTIML